MEHEWLSCEVILFHMTSEKFHVEQNCSTWTFLLHGQCPRQIWCMIVPIIGNSGLWEFCPNWEFSPNLGILGKLGIQAKFVNSAQIRNSTQIWEFYPYLGILPKIGNFPLLAVTWQLYRFNCLSVGLSGTITFMTLLTIVEQSQRLVTLETSDQSDDFRKIFRF